MDKQLIQSSRLRLIIILSFIYHFSQFKIIIYFYRLGTDYNQAAPNNRPQRCHIHSSIESQKDSARPPAPVYTFDAMHAPAGKVTFVQLTLSTSMPFWIQIQTLQDLALYQPIALFKKRRCPFTKSCNFCESPAIKASSNLRCSCREILKFSGFTFSKL